MKKFVSMTAAAALVAALGFGGEALARPAHLQPGSVLVYPLFDSQPQSATVINVTNTNQDRTACGNGFREGDVTAHYVYYGQDPSGGVCLEFDRFEELSPADTLTVLASDHNPEGEVGYLVVSANDPESLSLIDFDFLIGSAYVANSAIDIMWSYTPYPFEALGSDGTDNCGRDIVTTDNVIRFDDAEYASFPDILYVDSFFEETKGDAFGNGLTLMSTSGQDYINEVDFFFFNNKEDKFSRTFKFVCHTTVELSEVSSIARNLLGDPDEFNRETGWVLMDGRAVLDLAGNQVGDLTPALLGVFMQVVRMDFTAGHALHFTGTQDTSIPLELNN